MQAQIQQTAILRFPHHAFIHWTLKHARKQGQDIDSHLIGDFSRDIQEAIV
jgi:hypothetical protein